MSTYAPRAAKGHLIWANDSVSANFYIPTVNMDYPDPENRLGPWNNYTDLYSTLPAEWAHHTIDRQQPASDIVRRIGRNVEGGLENLIRYPEWQLNCAESIAFTESMKSPPTTRFDVLSVQLPTIKPKNSQGVLSSLIHTFSGELPDPPSNAEITSAEAEADKILERLQASVEGIRPLTDQELQWFQCYCTTFGGQETPYTHPMFDTEELGIWTVQPLHGAVLNNTKPRPKDHIVLDTEATGDPFLMRHPAYTDPAQGPTQAGLSAVRDALTFPVEPLHGTLTGPQRVYQTYLLVSKFPGAWAYPDYSIRSVADSLPFPTRISALGSVVENHTAQRSLSATFKHTEWTRKENADNPEPDTRTEESNEAAHAEKDALTQHDGPSLPTTLVIGIGAPTKKALDHRVNMLRDKFKAAKIIVERPKGLQTAIWHALHPGAPVHPAIHAYRRHMHGRDIAGLGLWHGHDLGDESGRLYGVQASTIPNASPRLVFRDIRRGLKADEGNQGSTAIAVGEPGSGKTTERKEDIYQTLSTGGGVYVLDRSPKEEREFVKVSKSWPVRTTIVDLAQGNTTVDLLRIHTANLPTNETIRKDQLAAAEKSATAFLALELDIPDEDDNRYYTLRAAVQLAVSGKVDGLKPSIPNVLRILEHWTGTAENPITHRDGTAHEELTARTGGRLEAAEAVLDRMKGLRESATMGEALFGDNPVLDLTAPAIIFSAPGLEFDNKRDRGRLYLATAIPLAFLPATERFNLVILPELAGLVKQKTGAELVDHLQRLARRVYGGLGGDTQLPQDIPNDDMVVFRSLSRVGKKKHAQVTSLDWLDLPVTAQLRKNLASMPSGYKYIRDFNGRVGCVQMIFPLNPERAWLTRTDAGRLNENGTLMTFQQMAATPPAPPDGTVYDHGNLTPQHPDLAAEADDEDLAWVEPEAFIGTTTRTKDNLTTNQHRGPENDDSASNADTSGE